MTTTHQFKASAVRMMNALQKYGVTIPYSQALEVQAQAQFGREWNTVRAVLLNASSNKNPEAPSTSVARMFKTNTGSMLLPLSVVMTISNAEGTLSLNVLNGLAALLMSKGIARVLEVVTSKTLLSSVPEVAALLGDSVDWERTTLEATYNTPGQVLSWMAAFHPAYLRTALEALDVAYIGEQFNTLEVSQESATSGWKWVGSGWNDCSSLRFGTADEAVLDAVLCWCQEFASEWLTPVDQVQLGSGVWAST